MVLLLCTINYVLEELLPFCGGVTLNVTFGSIVYRKASDDTFHYLLKCINLEKAFTFAQVNPLLVNVTLFHEFAFAIIRQEIKRFANYTNALSLSLKFPN